MNKMSAGFRKSLFGFNCDDVMEYIEKTHKDYVENETLLNEKISDLDSTLNDAKNEINNILSAKEEIEKELKVYTDKYDEIERLSQNIGKLYLVSETNANAVIKTAKESKAEANEEVGKNISCVASTQESLTALKSDVQKAADEFSEKLALLINSLELAKINLSEKSEFANEKIEEFEELLQEVKS